MLCSSEDERSIQNRANGLLLLIARVPGFASHVCAMPYSSRVHACCMGNDTMSTFVSGGSTTKIEAASCCKVIPPRSNPIQALSQSADSIDGVPALHMTSGGVFFPPVPLVRIYHGIPHLAKSLSPSVRAMLRTFSFNPIPHPNSSGNFRSVVAAISD